MVVTRMITMLSKVIKLVEKCIKLEWFGFASSRFLSRIKNAWVSVILVSGLLI